MSAAAAIDPLADAIDPAAEQGDAIDPATLDDTARQVRAALAAIPASARMERHDAATVIGLAIRHSESGIPESIGAALCAEWDKRVEGGSLAIFRKANPDYQATKPLGLASLYKLAREHGWTGGAESTVEEDPDSDFLTPPPRPTEAMFYGLVGDFAAAAAKGREVNRVSVAAAFMSWLSAQVGRDTYIQVGDIRHALHLFGLHTGRTAVAAKGESVGLVKEVDAEVRQSPISNVGEAGLLGQTHDGGLSSREGLTLFVHDGMKFGKEEIPPIEDKRLWIFEPEFQNVIAQGKREGNTLSAALRDVWDGGSIKPATKSARIWATEPHIALHGCITPFELRAGLEQKDISNGFGNRFLIIWAERTCLVALPRATPRDVVSTLARRCESVIKAALGQYPARKYSRVITLSPEAEAIWVKAYPTLKRREPMGETVTALLERRAPITLRLAGLFAITDKTLVINPDHLTAALAWSQYHRDSVVFIFGAEVEQRRKAMERDTNREKILAYLRGKDWVVRSEIISKGFSGHTSASAINDAIQAMLADGEIEQEHRAKGGAAKGHKTFYRLARAKHAKDDSTSTAAKDAKDAKDSVDTESADCERHAKDMRKTQRPDFIREVV